MNSQYSEMLSQWHFDEGFIAHLDVEISSDASDDLLFHEVEGRLSERCSWTEMEHLSKECDDPIESDAALLGFVMSWEVMLNLQ